MCLGPALVDLTSWDSLPPHRLQQVFPDTAWHLPWASDCPDVGPGCYLAGFWKCLAV